MKLDQKSGALIILAAAGIAAFVIYRSRDAASFEQTTDDGGDPTPVGDPAPVTPRVLSELDAHMPVAEAEAVTAAVNMETNAANLIAFANTLLPNFPVASDMLKIKAGAMAPSVVEETLTQQRVRKALLSELQAPKSGT